MQQRSLGSFTVSAIGLGCMNFCHAYGEPVSEVQTERVLLASLDAGITHFDTATLYGFGQSELLLGKYLMPHRKRFTLASKCGIHAVIGPEGKKVRAIDGRPATLRQNCEDSLKRLNTDVIDLYYLHRWDKAVPIEESVGALGDLVKAGKIRAVGLSEVSAATLRKAHAEFPISAVQSEYSLWTRNPEIAVLQTCAELGVALVAFSPVARGFLTSAPPEPAMFGATDFRKNMPRFAPETYAANCKLLPPFTKIAHEAGCTPAQLAIAWLLHKAPHILPIPGTTSVEHALENAAAVNKVLTPETLAACEALINSQTVQGNRYPTQARSEVDTEEIPNI